jgi:hypothetical protein
MTRLFRIMVRILRMSLAVGDWCEARLPKRPTSTD